MLACRDGLEAAARLSIPNFILFLKRKHSEYHYPDRHEGSLEMWDDEKQIRTEGAHIIYEIKDRCSSF
jgi:hypothetical protein